MSSDENEDDRVPLLGQKDFDKIEIRFVECTFTYTNLSALCSNPAAPGPSSTKKKVSFMDKLKNKGEKVTRNLKSLSKGDNINKRFVDCVYGVGDSKVRIQNHITNLKLQTPVRFVCCNFVDRNLSFWERLWRWVIIHICGGSQFTFQMAEGVNIVEITDDTMSIDAIPCEVHRALTRLQDNLV